MSILVLGNQTETHAVHILTELRKQGYDAHYLDTSEFPQQICLSWYCQKPKGRITLAEGKIIELAEIKSVFWRTLYPVAVPKLEQAQQYQIAYNDTMSALRTFLQDDSIHWVNCWRAYQFHKEKPLQLKKVQQLGVRIPDTLITNDPETVIEFAHTHPQVIFKPVYGGAHTKLLSSEYLDYERLQRVLKISPITLQEYIPGTNIRSYVIGKSVYSAEIRSDSLDFRLDPKNQLLPVQLPESVVKDCLAITPALWLEWTAIDWRLTPEGEYVFLEANFSPMFLHFERQTNFPITQSLLELITFSQGKNRI
jgi:glutathione synthase/RimK-type ligase-like ATP-grasp enzyme